MFDNNINNTNDNVDADFDAWCHSRRHRQQHRQRIDDSTVAIIDNSRQRVDAAAVNIVVTDNIADEFADNDAADVDLFSLQMGFVNISKNNI